MRDWTQWRMTVNELMSDVIGKQDEKGSLEAEREILVSTNTSKTPDFFLGDMYIHGQRVKDQYGCATIAEADDTDTKIEKKIIEGNFYLFGIPRISLRRSSEALADTDFAPLSTSLPQHNQRRTSIQEIQRRLSEHSLCAFRDRSQSLPTKCNNLVNSDNQIDTNRPFQGLAKARRASLSRRGSLASWASSEVSCNSLDSTQHAFTLPRIDVLTLNPEEVRNESFDDDDEQTLASTTDSCINSDTNTSSRSFVGIGLYQPSGQNHCLKEQITPYGSVRSSTMIAIKL